MKLTDKEVLAVECPNPDCWNRIDAGCVEKPCHDGRSRRNDFSCKFRKTPHPERIAAARKAKKEN